MPDCRLHVANSLPYKRAVTLPCFQAALVNAHLRSVSLRLKLSYNIWAFPVRRRQEINLKGIADDQQNWHWLYTE
jgi:hypothetical protein